jgi:hypothetical protein
MSSASCFSKESFSVMKRARTFFFMDAGRERSLASPTILFSKAPSNGFVPQYTDFPELRPFIMNDWIDFWHHSEAASHFALSILVALTRQ